MAQQTIEETVAHGTAVGDAAAGNLEPTDFRLESFNRALHFAPLVDEWTAAAVSATGSALADGRLMLARMDAAEQQASPNETRCVTIARAEESNEAGHDEGVMLAGAAWQIEHLRLPFGRLRLARLLGGGDRRIPVAPFCAPDDFAAAAAMLESLIIDHDVDAIDLGSLCETSATTAAFVRAIRSRPDLFHVLRTRRNLPWGHVNVPSIDDETQWPKRLRRRLKRGRNAAESMAAAWQETNENVRFASSGSTLDSDVHATIESIHGRLTTDYSAARGLDERAGGQNAWDSIAAYFARSGDAHAIRLAIGEHPAGDSVLLRSGDVAVWPLCTRRRGEGWDRLSAGHLMLAQHLSWAARAGVRTVETGLGPEPFRSTFGGTLDPCRSWWIGIDREGSRQRAKWFLTLADGVARLPKVRPFDMLSRYLRSWR